MQIESNNRSADLVFIHGYGGGACSWSLIDHGVRRIASPAYLELIGFGKRKPAKGFDYSIRAQAKNLAVQLRENGHDNATIVAHSMGAAVLLVAILEYGIKPGRVVLVDPLAYQQPLPFFISGQTLPVFSNIASKLLSPTFQVNLVLDAIYFDKAKIDPRIRKCYVEKFQTPFHRSALLGTARELSKFEAESFVSRYGQIHGEFHIIWGDDDPLISSDFMPRLKRDLDAISTHIIKRCGHAPHEECPDEFLYILGEILERK